MNEYDIERLETRLEYYIKMLERVAPIKNCISTAEELKTYYTKQINKCLEGLNGK